MDKPLGDLDKSFGSITEELTSIWKEILGLAEIDQNEHFLNLGGDSILAILCISRIRNRFSVELSVEEFFMNEATVFGQTRIIIEERFRREAGGLV